MARILLDHANVRFPIFSTRTRSVRAAVFTRLGGNIEAHDRTMSVEAMRDLSLELKDGDRLGVVGHNGAGKTTFLRVVSGVYPPVSGRVEIEGKISSFTDITLGMEPEATGWQNIIFRCVFLGLTFKQAQDLAPRIAEFSELGDYLALPVRTYSSGMFVRLAFSISTAVQPDIMVMDEMIGAGDQAFMEKAQTRLEELMTKARIMVLSSHDETIVRRFCTTTLWLEKGRAKMLGPTPEVMDAYRAARG
jgi:ABC-type polysaccharide/polyol phosphate transport system ATPase subunit